MITESIAGRTWEAPRIQQLAAEEAISLFKHGTRQASREALRRHCETVLGGAVTAADVAGALTLVSTGISREFQ